MRYLLRCHNCSHGDVPCDELREDHRCPHCDSVPSSYKIDGDEFCWLHREQLSATYPVSANFLYNEYAWRGEESQFPNAKLFEAHADERAEGSGHFCPKCQEVLERWLLTRE